MRRPTHLRACSIGTQHLAALFCALLWMGGGLAGCSFDARDCTLDSPCPSDHICDSATGICEPLSDDASHAEDAHHPDAASPPDTPSTDAGADSRYRFDAPPSDQDTSQPQEGEPLSGACLVDSSSTTCQEDQHELNDLRSAATSLSSEYIGCDHGDDELISFDTNTQASLCPGDRDWYKYELRTCRTRSFIVEAYVTPDKACDPRSYALEWRIGSEVKARCVDPELDGTQTWQCQALEGGGKKLAYIVDSERFQSSDWHTLNVEASELTDGRDVQFNYQLRARIKP
ncbi:MAG: hypothetical protein ACOC9J_04990 [Persicimonas sp.]